MPDPTLDTALLNDCMDRWRGGDLAGRDALVGVAVARLERLARKMLRSFPNVHSMEETCDVVQNVLMRLLRTLEKIRPASAQDFFNLAAVHIRRELIDLARRHRNRAAAIGGNLSEPGLDPAAQIPENCESTVELDRWFSFHESVEKLPVEEREVVGLIYYHGWTQAQVAELFGISDRTVRRRWEDALVKLNSVLGTDSRR